MSPPSLLPQPPNDPSARPADWEAFYRDYRKPGYVDGFEITTKLGGGMFGLVFRARRMSIGKDYAIKFLQVDDSEVRRAVLSELEQVKYFAQIDHPNLVSIEDRGEVDGIPFLVMAFAGTETLRDKMVAGRPPTADEKAELLNWFLQACRGLVALHERALVHFDIKPANVFLKGAVARLGDYGLSKLVTHSRGSLSMGRGTPYYMAPEMLQRRGDHRSDIYSLGVMLYEILCGKVPFTGDSEWEVLKQHETAAPELPAFLTARERTVLQRCLQKDPAARYASVMDVIAAFGAPAGVGAAAWSELGGNLGVGAGTAPRSATPPPSPPPPSPGAPPGDDPYSQDPYKGFGSASREAMKHARTIAQQAARKASVVVREAMKQSRHDLTRHLREWREQRRAGKRARREERRRVRDLARSQRAVAKRGVRSKLLTLAVILGGIALLQTAIRPHSLRGLRVFDVAKTAPIPRPAVVDAPGLTIDSASGSVRVGYNVPLPWIGHVTVGTPAWVDLAARDHDRAHEDLLQHIEQLRQVAPLSDAARADIGSLPTFQFATTDEAQLVQANQDLAKLLRGRTYPADVADGLAKRGAIMLRAAAMRLDVTPWLSPADVENARRLHRFLRETTECDDIRWLDPERDTPVEQGHANRSLGRLWLWFVNEFAKDEHTWQTFRSLLKRD